MAVQQQFETFSPVLHSLRGFAAVAVLLFHWEQYFPAGGHWLQQFSERHVAFFGRSAPSKYGGDVKSSQHWFVALRVQCCSCHGAPAALSVVEAMTITSSEFM